MDDIDKALNNLKDNEDINYKIVLVHEPDISDKIVEHLEDDNDDLEELIGGLVD